MENQNINKTPEKAELPAPYCPHGIDIAANGCGYRETIRRRDYETPNIGTELDGWILTEWHMEPCYMPNCLRLVEKFEKYPANKPV